MKYYDYSTERARLQEAIDYRLPEVLFFGIQLSLTKHEENACYGEVVNGCYLVHIQLLERNVKLTTYYHHTRWSLYQEVVSQPSKQGEYHFVSGMRESNAFNAEEITAQWWTVDYLRKRNKNLMPPYRRELLDQLAKAHHR